MSTAITFVLGSALASHVHTGGRQARSARLVAMYMTGVGIGVVISGVVVPAALTAWGMSGWQAGWLLMGVLAVLFTWVRHPRTLVTIARAAAGVFSGSLGRSIRESTTPAPAVAPIAVATRTTRAVRAKLGAGTK